MKLEQMDLGLAALDPAKAFAGVMDALVTGKEFSVVADEDLLAAVNSDPNPLGNNGCINRSCHPGEPGQGLPY